MMLRTVWSTAIASAFSLFLLASPTSSSAQELSFEFQVTIAGHASEWMAFGLRDGASTGLDDWDVPAPPPVPDAPFRAFLALPEPPEGLPNCWWVDFRPMAAAAIDRVELWQGALEAAAVGTACRLDVRVRNGGSQSCVLTFFGPDGTYQPLSLPSSVSFDTNSATTPLFFELRLDESVEVEACAWGGVLARFR
jgi:hypothetical protein